MIFLSNLKKEKPLISLIINGQLLKDQLKYIEKDEQWLQGQLKVQGYQHYQDILLALYDIDGTIYVYEKR